MPTTIKDLMNKNVVSLDAGRSVVDAAQSMKQRDLGNVLVTEGGRLRGIVTDRDIVVRCLAEGKDPGRTRLADFCTTEMVTLESDAPVDDAVRLMREKAIRRIPIMDHGKPVGVVSLGDLARERDPESALGRISAARANN